MSGKPWRIPLLLHLSPRLLQPHTTPAPSPSAVVAIRTAPRGCFPSAACSRSTAAMSKKADCCMSMQTAQRGECTPIGGAPVIECWSHRALSPTNHSSPLLNTPPPVRATGSLAAARPRTLTGLASHTRPRHPTQDSSHCVGFPPPNILSASHKQQEAEDLRRLQLQHEPVDGGAPLPRQEGATAGPKCKPGHVIAGMFVVARCLDSNVSVLALATADGSASLSPTGVELRAIFPGVTPALFQGFNVKSHGTGSQVKIPGQDSACHGCCHTAPPSSSPFVFLQLRALSTSPLRACSLGEGRRAAVDWKVPRGELGMGVAWVA